MENLKFTKVALSIARDVQKLSRSFRLKMASHTLKQVAMVNYTATLFVGIVLCRHLVRGKNT